MRSHPTANAPPAPSEPYYQAIARAIFLFLARPQGPRPTPPRARSSLGEVTLPSEQTFANMTAIPECSRPPRRRQGS